MAQTNPIQSNKDRLEKYTFNQKLFLGKHFDAFKMKTTQFGKDYDGLRYVMANFAGMLSKLSADMLFQEFPKIQIPDDTAQEWLEKVMLENGFATQLYESGMQNSYRGDAVFRIRSEVIDANKQASRMILEDITPEIYFPVIDTSNARKEPKQHVLAWEVTLSEADKTKGVFMEIHEKGKIKNELYSVDASGQMTKLVLQSYYKDMPDEIETNVDDFLIVHIKNFGIGTMPFGISDYDDLTPLFYAINNRITRVDNILDKHGDPILAVPEGVLDAEGKVRKESFGVIEIPGNEKEATPQYIVWDAKLESAFSEIEQLMQFLYMVSGTSATAFGMGGSKQGQGQAESGRALKFKMLRTIANKARKELYYDDGLKRLLTVAQKFAIANKLQTSDGTTLKGKPLQVEIEWSDGILNDRVEDVEVEEKRINMGTSSAQQSIVRLDSVSEEEAQKRVEEITAEQKALIPEFAVAPVTINPNGKQN